MKIKLTLEMDLPDEYNGIDDPFLRIHVSEGFIQYARTKHLEDVIEALTVEPEKYGNVDDVVTFHRAWAKIIGDVSWTIEDNN